METGFAQRVERAHASLGERGRLRPTVGVILGSGLGDFADAVGGAEVPFASIEGFPRSSVAGHAGILRLTGSLAVMQGRIHYYEGWSMDDVVLPVFLLHRLGVRTLVVTNAAGGVNRQYAAGDLVLIRDHVNLMGANPLRGPNPELGPRFPDMSSAYDPILRDLARSVSDTPLREGVYAGFAGPSYETPAEIRMCAAIGADLVGMSTVPEVIVASYLGMKVLGISCVTNMAAGILEQPLSHAEVMEVGRAVGPRFSRLLGGIIGKLGAGTGAGAGAEPGPAARGRKAPGSG
jgi:purine-nucleoside phosphorylase